MGLRRRLFVTESYSLPHTNRQTHNSHGDGFRDGHWLFLLLLTLTNNSPTLDLQGHHSLQSLDWLVGTVSRTHKHTHDQVTCSASLVGTQSPQGVTRNTD